MPDWCNNMRRAFLWAAVITAWTAPVRLFAASSEPAMPPYVIRTWRTDDGLPQNAVTSVVQTKDGYIWVGTYGGLARFDGVHFRVFKSGNTVALRRGRVTSLFEDPDGPVDWSELGELTAFNSVSVSTSLKPGPRGDAIDHCDGA